MNVCYGFQSLDYFVILLFFVQSYDKVYVVDSVRNVGVRRERGICKLVRYGSSFLVTYIVLRCQFGVLPFPFIDFTLIALPSSLELLLWYIITLFLLSISCDYFYIPSNELRIACHILISCNFILF